MSSRKMGRPTDDPKTNEIKVKMSDRDMEKLNYIRKGTGLTISDIVRKGVEIQYGQIKKWEVIHR